MCMSRGIDWFGFRDGNITLVLCLCAFPNFSNTALQAGPQVQARDQAGEEAATAGPC